MLETWFLYSLASATLFGLITIVDKLILEKRLSSFSYLISFALPAVVFCIYVSLSFPTHILPIPYTLAFVAGLTSAGGYFGYALSIRKEEASRIAALTSLAPVFVAVLAFFLANEIFSLKSYAGIILMIIGSALISYKRNNVKRIIPLSLALVLVLTNFSYSLAQTFSKISLNQISFWPFLMVFMLGRSTPAILGLGVPSIRNRFRAETRDLGRNFTLTLISGSVMWSLDLALFFYAASLGPITLVSTTLLTSPLFTLFFAILATKYLRVLEEQIDRRTIALKFVAITLIVFGTYLITS